MDPYTASQPLTGEYQPMGPDEDEHQNGFFKKVFGIVASQLLFTAFFCAFCMASTEITEFLIENVWIVIVFLVLGVVCMCLPLCSKTFSRRVPHNYINLGIFTTCFSVAVALPCVVFPPELVIVAGVLTVLVTWGCVIGAMKATKDRYCGVMILWAMIFNVVGTIFLMICFPIHSGSVLLCALGVIVYALYIILDVYFIFSRGRYGITHEDYIFAAMVIYLDIIQLFLEILRLLAALSK